MSLYPHAARTARAKHTHASAFTLIELSIVLIIIGLIIGGVLAGRELIAASAMRAQISQIERYNTAVNTFFGKYDCLPGDCANVARFGFNVSGCDGSQGHRDGNGLIDGWIAPYILDEPIGETGVFWDDLSVANLLESTLPGSGVVRNGCADVATPVTSATAGGYFPAGKIGYGTFVYVYENNNANWFGLSAIISADGWQSLYSNASIPVAQAYNIDKKIDDGYPTSGFVLTMYINGADGNSSLASAPSTATSGGNATSCYDTTTNAYSVGVNNGNGNNCALSFKMRVGN